MMDEEQESKSGYSAEDFVRNDTREITPMPSTAVVEYVNTVRHASNVDEGDGSHLPPEQQQQENDEILFPVSRQKQRENLLLVTPCRTPPNESSALPELNVDLAQLSKVIFRSDGTTVDEKSVLRHRRSLSNTFPSSTVPVSSVAAAPAGVGTSETAEMMWLSGPEDEFSFNLPPPLESNQCTPAVQQASQQHMPTIFVSREEVLKEEAKFAHSATSATAQHASAKERLSGPLDRAAASAATGKKRLPMFYFLLRDILVNFWTNDGEADEDEQPESQQSMNDKCKRVYAFILIPRDLEKFLLLASFQCFDAFLFVFTLLPLRLLMTLAYLFIYPLRLARRFLLRNGTASNRKRLWLRPLKPGHVSVLLKAAIIVCTLWALNQVDLSFVYHVIKLQSTVKLYMLYNMFEVADRLLSSFGQDILDSLFLAAASTEPPSNDSKSSDSAKLSSSTSGKAKTPIAANPQYFSTATSFLIATCGTFVHSLLIILQLTVLNVAFNSEGQSLLIILMANNFVEIKSNVFKKYNRVNLYHIACTDARERFMSILLLAFIILRNMQDIGWEWKHWGDLGVLMFALFVTEILVDWMKHAFICKFNCLPADVYSDYMVSIAYDMLKWRREGNTVGMLNDQSDAVATKLGFIAVPTCCALIRVVQQSISFETFGVRMAPNSSTVMQFALLSFLLYMLLFALKCVMSVVLLGKSLRIMEKYVKDMAAAGEADARDADVHDGGGAGSSGERGDMDKLRVDEATRLRRRHSWNVIVRNNSASAEKLQKVDKRKRKFSDLGVTTESGFAPQSLPSSPILTRKKLLSLRIGSLNPLPARPLHVRWNSMKHLNNNTVTEEEGRSSSSRLAAGAKAVSYEFVHA